MPTRAPETVNSVSRGGKPVGRGRVALRTLSALTMLCVAALAGAGHAASVTAAGSDALCREVPFADVDHIVCEISPASQRGGLRIDLHWKDGGDDRGAPFGALGAVERELVRQGRLPLVTMNAGMYEEDLSPLGLFVANGRTLKPLNTRGGGGNFYLKPNGVFLMTGERARIMETRAFARSGLKPTLATQSGPMLVMGGRLHPRFLADGDSRKIRNGIGVRKDGTIVLAISRRGISFGQFALLFRDALQCPDALYLDGSVSQLSRDGAAGREPAGSLSQLVRRPLGPILSVSAD